MGRIRWRWLIGGVYLLAAVLAGCGGQAAAPPPPLPTAAPTAGDPSAGKALFTSGAKPPCATCHAIEGISTGQTGPDLTHIGATAAQRVQDPKYTNASKDVASYLRESIVMPNAFIAPQCPAGQCFKDIMPQNFAATLSEQQISDLMAFLIEQR